jgi:putative acetyltransferase
MARATPTFALRPYVPDDAPVLAGIFAASIEALAADDYSESQVDAWAAVADDEDEFALRVAGLLTLVATLEGSPVGFASLEAPGHLDLLYVHPAVAGQGVGTMLLDALEKLAAARGASKLTVDASDNAQDFFRARGFKAMQRNSVPLGGEWFANTTMEKPLEQKRSAQ